MRRQIHPEQHEPRRNPSSHAAQHVPHLRVRLGKAAVGDHAAHIRRELKARRKQNRRRPHRKPAEEQRMRLPQHLPEIRHPRDHVIALLRAEGQKRPLRVLMCPLVDEQQVVAQRPVEQQRRRKVHIPARAVAVEQQNCPRGILRPQKLRVQPFPVIALDIELLRLLFQHEPLRGHRLIVDRIRLQIVVDLRLRGAASARTGQYRRASAKQADRRQPQNDPKRRHHVRCFPHFPNQRNVIGQPQPANSTSTK